jgi:hypothetical protein
VPGDLAMGLAVIVDAPQIIAIWHRCEGAIEGQDFQSVAGKIKVADNFWPQQRDHIGTHGEFEARKDFFRDRGAPEHMTALQH